MSDLPRGKGIAHRVDVAPFVGPIGGGFEPGAVYCIDPCPTPEEWRAISQGQVANQRMREFIRARMPRVRER